VNLSPVFGTSAIVFLFLGIFMWLRSRRVPMSLRPRYRFASLACLAVAAFEGVIVVLILSGVGQHQ
jgi:hypothetical protein